MRKLARLCGKLARSVNRYFIVTKYDGRRYVVHEYDPYSLDLWSLGSFCRVADVERFLLDKFN